jgi:UrcA family protein
MKTTAIVCAVALIGLSAAAHAEQATSISLERTSIQVPYGDLDLNHPAGAKTMMFRLRNASTDACGGLPNIREMRERRVFKICLRQTMAAAVNDLGSAQVAALFKEDLENGRV